MDILIIRYRPGYDEKTRGVAAERENLIMQLREASHGAIILEPESLEIEVAHIEGATEIDTILIQKTDGKIELIRETL